MRYHLISIRIAIIFFKMENSVDKDMEKLEPSVRM
jgi:hypothetical protein